MWATIPASREAGPAPVAMTAPSDESTEAYRGLRTSVEFLALDRSLGG